MNLEIPAAAKAIRLVNKINPPTEVFSVLVEEPDTTVSVTYVN